MNDVDQERLAEWEAKNREEWKRETPFHVVFEFETLQDKEAFLGWMSDGGGEYNAMEAMSFKEMEGRYEDRSEAREAASSALDDGSIGFRFLYHNPDASQLQGTNTERVKVIRCEDEEDDEEDGSQ